MLADAERRLERSPEEKSRALPFAVTLAIEIARSTGSGESGDALFSGADKCMYEKRSR